MITATACMPSFRLTSLLPVAGASGVKEVPMASSTTSAQIPCYCALCISRCGAIAHVENGRFVALEPDPSHPTGRALCAKGKVAPEIVYNQGRLLYPLKRTTPKSDPDPGWVRISWDEALDATAAALSRIAREYGPESVGISVVSPSTSAIADAMPWIERLMHAFGTPNLCQAMELCGWGRFAAAYTFGIPVGLPGTAMPDLENSGCILFWGYNPASARISHATSALAAMKRGAKLIVIDPRQAGLANKADLWLRPRPGADAAVALGIAHVMIEHGWYDREFVRAWTNGPLLVRADTGRFLRSREIQPNEPGDFLVAWDEASSSPVLYDTERRLMARRAAVPALDGAYEVATVGGMVTCRPAFGLARERCALFTPEIVEEIAWVPSEQIEAAAQLLWDSRPVSYFAWAGVEQHTGTTQISRAISFLYTLTGCFGGKGGNVRFTAPSAGIVSEVEQTSARPRAKALGLAERPLGPGVVDLVTSDEMYRAILDSDPYPMRGLVGFGANMLMAHADSLRGRNALEALDFFVHADLFMNPTAEKADIVLPVSTPFEREALKIGFESSAEAQRLVQLRKAIVDPIGESRADTEIVFDLACRLGLGDQFWDGDIDAGYRQQLEPLGITLGQLREEPSGVRLQLETRYRTFEEEVDGGKRGFATPTGKIEIYSERFLENGYDPLANFEEPLVSQASRPDLAEAFPLVLTCAHNTHFCETQHRGIPGLRKLSRDPEVEMHASVAAARGLSARDWARIETPHGSVRARVRLNDTLDPRVVVGQHGWWEACEELGEPAYDPFSENGANLNLIVSNESIDPVSGTVPHRSYICEIRAL